jgi:hypothetical protein
MAKKGNGTYIASFRTCVQISPDDFETTTESMVCTPQTTVADIVRWYQSSIQYGPAPRMIAVDLTECAADSSEQVKPPTTVQATAIDQHTVFGPGCVIK